MEKGGNLQRITKSENNCVKSRMYGECVCDVSIYFNLKI